MKVLIVNRYMSIYGGAEQVVKGLSSNLTKKGIEIQVLTLNISEEVKEIAKGTRFIIPDSSFPYESRSTSFISSVGILKEMYYLRKLLKKYYKDFDVINVHNFPANWIVYDINKPVVWMCNEIPDFYNNPHLSIFIKGLRAIGIEIDKYLVNKFIDIICVADRLNSESVIKRYKRKSYIVPYGIDFPADTISFQDKKGEIYRKYRLEKEDFILLQVGVVSPTKNQKDSVDVLIGLKDTIHNIKLILAGSDRNPYGDYLKEHIKINRLEDKVIFTGLIPKEEVYRLYSNCNLCLFPVKLQGGYLSVFEALTFEVPVIVYPTMGAASLVKENGLGVVSQDLLSYVKEIYHNYSFYKEKAKKASVWVKNNLTWEKFSENLVEIFNRAYQGEKL